MSAHPACAVTHHGPDWTLSVEAHKPYNEPLATLSDHSGHLTTELRWLLVILDLLDSGKALDWFDSGVRHTAQAQEGQLVIGSNAHLWTTRWSPDTWQSVRRLAREERDRRIEAEMQHNQTAAVTRRALMRPGGFSALRRAAGPGGLLKCPGGLIRIDPDQHACAPQVLLSQPWGQGVSTIRVTTQSWTTYLGGWTPQPTELSGIPTHPVVAALWLSS